MKAKDIMVDMLNHTKQVTKDFHYMIAMDSFEREASRGFKFPNYYGILKKTINNVNFAVGSSIGLELGTYGTKHDLLMFENYIIALELENNTQSAEKQTLRHVRANFKFKEGKTKFTMEV